jgi:hypothetical protein
LYADLNASQLAVFHPYGRLIRWLIPNSGKGIRIVGSGGMSNGVKQHTLRDSKLGVGYCQEQTVLCRAMLSVQRRISDKELRC